MLSDPMIDQMVTSDPVSEFVVAESVAVHKDRPQLFQMHVISVAVNTKKE